MPSPVRRFDPASQFLPLLAALAVLGAGPAREARAHPGPTPDATPTPVAEATPGPAPVPAANPAPTPEATAAPEGAAAAAKPAPVEVTSFVDTYYGYFFNKPTGNVPLRNFDTKHNTFSLGLVEVA